METRSKKRIKTNQVRCKDDAYLMHYGVKGQKYGQHDPNRRWQSQAVYANGQPDPDAKERRKSGEKQGLVDKVTGGIGRSLSGYEARKNENYADQCQSRCN